jgi:hypothetical protein
MGSDSGNNGDARTDAPSEGSTSDPCANALASLVYDFESGDQGFTHGISDGVTPPPAWPYDSWTRGSASMGTACKSGSCWGVELTQNYAQCERGYLLSPSVDLSACKGRSVSVAFDQAYSFWTGNVGGTTYYDGGVVEVSADGTTWQLVTGATSGTVAINPSQGIDYACVQSNGFGVNQKAGFVGASATTSHVVLAIPASAMSSTTQVRFSFASGVSSMTSDPDQSRSATSWGWRIDNVSFVAM